MPFNWPRNSSIFQDGKIKSGIYKIQNVYSQTYLDILEHSREACCRPDWGLEKGKGLWEIKPLGSGYSVQRVEPDKPDQYCAPLEGIQGGTPLFVGTYPVAWRIEVVDDDKHRGFDYVCIFWANTKSAWDLHYGGKEDGTKVHFWSPNKPSPWQIWKFVPVKTDDAFKSPRSFPEADGSAPLPPYDEDPTGESSSRTEHVESVQDGFGTTVTKVTVVTTVTKSTVTTRKKYRVENP